LHLSLFFFGSFLGVFENFAKKDKVPQKVPLIAQVVFVTSPKALSEPQLPTLRLVCGALGRIRETHLCHMMLLSQNDEDTNYITRTSTPAAPEAPCTSTPTAPEAPPAPSTPLGAPPAQTSFPPPGPITWARARELNYIMLLKNEGPEA
jgi:hypothetical protein